MKYYSYIIGIYSEKYMGTLMKPEFRKLRVGQLERALRPFLAAKDSPRPQKGWIRAIREATGITLREMATRLGKAQTTGKVVEDISH